MDKESKYIGLNESPPGEEKGQKLAYQSSPSRHEDPEIVKSGGLEKYHPWNPSPNIYSPESILSVTSNMEPSSWNTIRELKNVKTIRDITTDIKTNQMETRLSLDKKGKKDPQIVKSGGLEKYHPYDLSPNINTIASSPESILSVKKYIEPRSRNTVCEIDNVDKLGEITTDIKTNKMKTRLSDDKKGQKLAYESSPSSHENPQIVTLGRLDKYHQYKPISRTQTKARSPERIFCVEKYIEPLPWNTLRNEEKLREIIPDIKINQMKTRLSVLPDTENTATVLNKCSKLMLDIAPRAVKKVFLHAYKHVQDFEFRELYEYRISNSSQRDDLDLHSMVILLLEFGGKLHKISMNYLQRHTTRQNYLLYIPNNTDKSLRGVLLNIDYYHRWFFCVNKQNIARTELAFMWQTITEAVVRIAGKDFLSEIEILATSQKCDLLEIPDKDIARGIGDSIDSSSTQSKKEADRLMSISQQVVDDNTLQTLSKSEKHHAESCTSESFEEKQDNYLKMVPLLETEYDTKGKVKSSELASLFEALREGDVKIVESELIGGTHVDVCDDNGVTPLHVACQHGHINVVKILLKHGVKVNCRDRNGVTPLYVACQHGHINVVKILYQHGVKVNGRDRNEVTPLHVACQHGHTDIVKFLLHKVGVYCRDSYGVIVNCYDKNGVTPLHVVCQNGHTDIVKLLLEHRVIHRRNGIGLTPLHVACQHGHTDTVKLLLQHGADAKDWDNYGATPLHVACQHGHTDTVKLLLQNKVDVNGCGNNRVTTLHVACQHGHTDTVKLLLQHEVDVNGCDNNGVTPLHVACQHGHTDIVKLLLQHGVDVNGCDNNGTTPLHVACQHGHTDIVKLLLQHGVDVNGCDNNGTTPLHVACQHGYTDTVKLLLQHEVDVNGCDNNGTTPLHVACQHGHTDTVKLLLQHEVDVNCCDNNGVTPLHVACQHGHTDIVELLLQHEVDVNRCNNNRVTPLHVACQHGHTDIVKLLLQHRVDVNRCNNSGVTPLRVACHGHTDIVELLLQHEIDVNRCDPDGATPLHVACQHGHINTVKLLLSYGARVQCCDRNGVTPLHVALQLENMELVKVLNKMDGKQKFANQDTNIKGDISYSYDSSEIDRIQKIFDKIDISVPASKRQYVVPQGKLFHIYFIYSSDKNDTIWVESIIKSIEKRGFKCCKKLATTMNEQTFEQVEHDSCAICLVLSRCFIDKERECLKFWLSKHFKGLVIQLCGCEETDLFLDANCQEHIKWYEILLEYLKYIDVQNVSVIANEMFNCNPSTAFRVKSSATGVETIEILILTDKLEKPILTTILENRVKITNPKVVSRESSVILGKSQQERQLTREEMITAKRVIQANSDQLFQNHRNLNIITTSNVRSKQGGEEVISEPCIVLHCYCKGLIPEEETKFPTYLKWENDQLPVDVREGFFEFGPRYNTDASTNYHEKLKMGCGFGIVDSKLEGTVGPFLKCYGGVGFLTCAHATCDVDPGNYHYCNQKLNRDYCFHQGKRFLVLQPPPNTFKNSGHNLNTEVCAVGEVYEAIFKPNCRDKKESSIDVGVVKITNRKRIPQRGEFAVISESNLNSANFTDLPLFEGSVITDPLLINTDARIVKFGMTTHVTRGILNSNGTVVRSNIGGLRSANQSSYVSTFQNQYEVGSISTCPIFFQGGDSGSGVFQVEKRGDKEILHLIGLAIGFTSYFSAIVTPIKDIMDALQIDAGAFNLSQELSSGASSSSAT